MTDKQIIIDEQMENLNNLATQQLKRIEEEKRQIEHIVKTHLVETFDMQREIDKLKKELKAKEQECEELNEELYYWVNGEYCDNKCNVVKELDQLKAENEILKEKFEIAIKNNMDKTLLRLENGDVKEELQEIREEFGIETLYCHDDNTRVHRCLDVLRLKDVLTEIKEIAEGVKGYDPLAKQILQKISECEVE